MSSPNAPSTSNFFPFRVLLQLLSIGVFVGVVLAGIYALKAWIWSGKILSLDEVLGFVCVTVIATLFLRFMDSRKKSRFSNNEVRPTPPENELARVCCDAFKIDCLEEFECWVPDEMQTNALTVKTEQILENRTWNHQRVILLMSGELPTEKSTREILQDLRKYIRFQLKPSWIRGLAAGIILESKTSTPSMELLSQLVSVKAESPATIQWFIWFNRKAGVAIGVHTVMEISTTPCFVQACLWTKTQGLNLDVQALEAKGILGASLELHKKIPPWLQLLAP